MGEIRDKYPLLFKDNQEKIDKKFDLAWREVREIAHLLKNKYDVEKVIVFGSLLDKDRFHLSSDIDLAVEGIDDSVFYKAYGEIIGEYTDFKVDLVDLKDCKESLLDVIKNEGREI